MKNLILGLSILMSSGGYAAAAEGGNIFHADLTHPDLALAVSAFENTCMPFVLHKTEMTRETDKRHMAKLMTSRGFAFQTSVKETKRFLIEPKREPWKSARYDQEPLKGQFTIFNGISNQVVPSVQTIINPNSGEISGVRIPAKYRSILIETETYDDLNEPRLSVHLGWNYPSQNHPGKQCEIKLSTPEITLANFTSNFIDKDKDWLSTDRLEQPTSWSQCVRDGEDEFEFTVKHKSDSLLLHVTRNDFYSPDICINWLPTTAALQ